MEGGRSGKFGVRIRKMKPEPITVKRRKRQAWGKYEKKEETVMGTLLVSLICFKIFCISRKNHYVESDDEDGDESAITTNPAPAQTGGTNVNGFFSSAIIDGPTDYSAQPSNLEYPDDVSSSLPGAVGEADPPAVVAAIAAPTSLPLVSMQQATADLEGQVLNLGDLELTGLPSCEILSSAPNEQKKESDKKQKKKDKKKKKYSKKTEKQAAVEKKRKSSKAKDKKKSKDNPSSKIPSMKEWAKQEEKKKKIEKKQQKKELKEEKQKQKQMEKLVAKAEKQKKAQKLKEEKEIKKAEKEAAKAKKASEKAEKAVAKAKEAAAKAEAKKKEKHSKWERRMQQMLEESDKQLAADLERERMNTEERMRQQKEALLLSTLTAAP